MTVLRIQPGAANALLRDLDVEQRVVTRFVSLLQSEQRALKENLVDSLEQFAQEKYALVGELNRLSSARERNMRLAPGGSAEAWIAGAGGAAAVKAWREVVALAREAQHLNYVNGVLIEMLTRTTRQAINALQAAARSAALYGPDGQTRGYSGGRVIGAV